MVKNMANTSLHDLITFLWLFPEAELVCDGDLGVMTLECQEKAPFQLLLERVERMEQAAQRGIELNRDRDTSIPAEKTISVEQCEWTLKDCAMFRRFINDAFEKQQRPAGL